MTALRITTTILPSKTLRVRACCLVLSSALVAACGDGAEGSGGSRSPDGSTSQTGVDIEIAQGALHGMENNGVRRFLGIPFAAPPVGELRWKAPQPPAAWDGVLDATAPRSVCEQISQGQQRGAEDCLYLNVWTPAQTPDKPLPVMVWVHGGAFVSGSGSDYAGEKLVVAGNVLVVTVNYRLHALGFLAHSALTAEQGTSGNWGLMDQRAALEWVRDNIAAFGGDPSNVTIFGQSAGGLNTCAQLVSPASRGLFHRMVSQSGGCASSILPLRLDRAQQFGDQVAQALGCTDPSTVLSCLRSKTPEELRTAVPPGTEPGGIFYQTVGGWRPVIDDQVIPDTFQALFASGAAEVPVLLGTNTNEGTLFHSGVAQDTPVADATEYSAALQRRFGSNAPAVEAQYPPDLLATPSETLAEVTGDAFFVCPARRAARLLANAGKDVFLYTFNRGLQGQVIGAGKVLHSGELPFIFGYPSPLGSVADVDQPLSEAMMGYWTHFAASGDPNGDGAVAWPKYEQASDAHILLDLPISSGSEHKKVACDFWDSLGL